MRRIFCDRCKRKIVGVGENHLYAQIRLVSPHGNKEADICGECDIDFRSWLPAPQAEEPPCNGVWQRLAPNHALHQHLCIKPRTHYDQHECATCGDHSSACFNR